MDSAYWRELGYVTKWAAIGLAIVTVLVLALVFAMPAHAHDWKRPDLDGWYGSLKRPGVSPTQPYGAMSCCSKTDCHTTEAELRGGDWWARIGVPRSNGDWDLKDWIKVPAYAVLQQHDNPTGEGVICHSLAWGMSMPGQEQPLNAAAVTVYCFVPPTES